MGEICEQQKDEKRYGNRTLMEIHEHMAEHGLVGWAWSPGKGRNSAPVTQQQLGTLIQPGLTLVPIAGVVEICTW